jgi:hypothetical protein
LKSFLTIILALIALCGGFYALVRFSGLDPEEFFLKTSKTSEFQSSVEPNKLQILYDSLENINFVLRRETDERQIKNLKETQKNLWARIVLTRNALSKTDTPQSINEGETELIDSLIKGISITAAVLLSIIILLIIKITRRSKEVEKVTKRLMSLQAEPPPPPPLGGMDATVIPQRYRPSPLPQVKPYEQKSEPEPPKAVEMPKQTSEQPVLRKTAKQRVTEAVQKMREALDRLRNDGTKKMQSPSDPTGVRGLTKTQIRVPSLNNTRITQPGDETAYDRRGRDNKQILNYAKQGRTSSEIAKWLNLSRDQVETVIRLARERGEI